MSMPELEIRKKTERKIGNKNTLQAKNFRLRDVPWNLHVPAAF